MTKQQERRIAQIENYMLSLHCRRNGENDYEIKYRQADQLTENIVSLVVEVGMKNDEGTYAALLCRDRIHVFIGKKGGVRCYVTARSGPQKGKQVEYTDDWLGCCHRSMEENCI